MNLRTLLQRIWRFLQRENLHRLVLLIAILVFLSSIGMFFFEPGLSLASSFWWSIVTLTTVGYGDISPVTIGGRVIAVMIMFFGIGLLGMLSATLASILVDKKFKENRGMSSYHVENHIILCEWNHRARAILKELRCDPQTAVSPIVLIAELDQKPCDDEHLFFIQGAVTDDTLKRANLSKAKTVIILNDDCVDATASDAKVVLTTLTVEAINPDVYTIVELLNEANVPHCQRAKADEIIVSSELSSGLISRAALHHGITRIVSELLSSQRGSEFYKVPVPRHLEGQPFIEAFVKMKQDQQCIVVAIEQGDQGQVLSNPPEDYQLRAHDLFIVIANENPMIT